MPVQHHFTVDVEEHFQVSALENYVARSQWDSLPSRVQASTVVLLDLLDEYNVRGTFFILSWVAERYPSLVVDIARRGHEVASHGTDHRQVTQLTPAEFRVSVRESKQILEDISGQRVLGYRAPSFSIVPGREWALDTLIEEGYVYDSSLFPVKRPTSGFPGTLWHPHKIARSAGVLVEFPPTTLTAFGKRFPAGGGAYLRLISPRLVRAGLVQAERANHNATVYIHPWEVDPGQPRFPVPIKTRIRHYGGLRGTAQRLRFLLEKHQFGPIAESLGKYN